MEEITIKNLHDDLMNLRKEIELVMTILVSEGKLSKWAIKEMIKARKEGEAEYTNLENL